MSERQNAETLAASDLLAGDNKQLKTMLAARRRDREKESAMKKIIMLVAVVALAGCSGTATPTVETVTETATETVTSVVTEEVVVETVTAPASCLAALDAADAMSLDAANSFQSFSVVIGSVPDAIEAAVAWDVAAMEAVTEIITAENEKIDTDRFGALVDDYAAKRDACRAEASQ